MTPQGLISAVLILAIICICSGVGPMLAGLLQ